MPNSRDFQDAHQLKQLGQKTHTPASPRAAVSEMSGLAAFGRYVGCADHAAASPTAPRDVFVAGNCDTFA